MDGGEGVHNIHTYIHTYIFACLAGCVCRISQAKSFDNLAPEHFEINFIGVAGLHKPFKCMACRWLV